MKIARFVLIFYGGFFILLSIGALLFEGAVPAFIVGILVGSCLLIFAFCLGSKQSRNINQHHFSTTVDSYGDSHEYSSGPALDRNPEVQNQGRVESYSYGPPPATWFPFGPSQKELEEAYAKGVRDGEHGPEFLEGLIDLMPFMGEQYESWKAGRDDKRRGKI